MNSPKNQQIEFDVFPKDTKSNYAYLSGVKGEASPESAPINVVFSHQSIIIVFIGIILLLVASFTLGVDKGKLVSRNAGDREKASLGRPAAALTQAGVEGALALAPATPTNIAPGSPQANKIVTPAIVATSPALIAETQKTQTPTDKLVAGGYVIQVASVKSQNAAKQLAENLAKKGWKSSTKSSGSYVIVLAGNFSKREDAQNSIKELKKTYSDCFIKKI